jgi:hypothetical protein
VTLAFQRAWAQTPFMATRSVKRDEYSAFSRLLKRVVSVPHSEIKARLEKEKARKTKRASSGRVSGDKG